MIPPRRAPPVISPGDLPPEISTRWFLPSDFPLTLRASYNGWSDCISLHPSIVFAKPVIRRLTPGSHDYTNPNTNRTRPSRHLIWPEGDHRGEITRGNLRGKLPEGVHRGDQRGEFTCCIPCDVFLSWLCPSFFRAAAPWSVYWCAFYTSDQTISFC